MCCEKYFACQLVLSYSWKACQLEYSMSVMFSYKLKLLIAWMFGFADKWAWECRAVDYEATDFL